MTQGRPEDAPYPASPGEQPPLQPRDTPVYPHAAPVPPLTGDTRIPAHGQDLPAPRHGRHAGPPEQPPAPPADEPPTEIMGAVPPDDGPPPAAPRDVPTEVLGVTHGDGPAPSGVDQETVGLRRPADLAPPPAPGGRAERRRAARRKGGHRGTPVPPAAPPAPPPGVPDGAVTGGRAARRRAAKAAAKAARQTGTAISNVIGELFITTGVVLLLFVVYQLWWTNVEARAHARHEADSLQEQWEDPGDPGEEAPDPRAPGAFSPGEGFAILYLPTLDVRVAIAQGVDEEEVLDNGMVGHYTEEDGLPTAMPWDEQGNVGLAGHRNTHGEPFRYINKLDPGDPIVIETQDAYFTYEMTSRLDSTSPSNVAVLDAVPDQGGFSEPGRYITLTTCTPEFTSTYRLIVWGELTEERPRSEGKPDALVQ